jgi:hypothetical protein
MAEVSATHKHVSLGKENIDDALDEHTDMEVPVDDNDHDWSDTDKGDSDSESENEPQQQHEGDHEDNVQHVLNGIIPNSNVHPKLAFEGINRVHVDTEN